MNLRKKAELIWQTLISVPNEINLEQFNWEQLKKISSLHCGIFAIIWYFMIFIILSIIDKIRGYNHDIEGLFIFGAIILIFTALYLKYLVIKAKEEYEKRQENRTKNKTFLEKDIKNLNAKELDALCTEGIMYINSLYERQKGISAIGFLDGMYYTLYYLFKKRGIEIELPYTPIFKNNKWGIDIEKPFCEQMVEYGLKQLDEADRKNSKNKNQPL